MKQYIVAVCEFEAVAVTVAVEGGVEQYAKALLCIFNNVRENRELLSVSNYAGSDDITVYCVPTAEAATREYLEYYGTVKRSDKVLAYQMVEPREYDFDKYDDAIVVPYFER